MTDLRARPARPGARTLIAVHVCMIPTGASQAIYGPSLPAIVERFGVTVSSAGLLIGAHGIGALAGIALWAALQRRLGLHRFCALAAGLLALGTLALGTAGSWPVMIAGAVVTGTGFGGLASGINMYVTGLLGIRAAPVLTSLAGVFGLGSISAPMLLGWVGLPRHATVFLMLAAVAVASVPLLLAGAAAAPVPRPASGARRPTGMALGFMLAVTLYTALEVGIGGWQATHLVALGQEPATAARWTAAFWTAFTVGRFVAAPLAIRVAPRTMAWASVIATSLALSLAVPGWGAQWGYVAAGLALAPLFPALFAWFSTATMPTTSAAALFFMSGSVGAALLPPLIGVLASQLGHRAIPASLAAIALGFLLVAARLRAGSPAGDAAAITP